MNHQPTTSEICINVKTCTEEQHRARLLEFGIEPYEAHHDGNEILDSTQPANPRTYLGKRFIPVTQVPPLREETQWLPYI